VNLQLEVEELYGNDASVIEISFKENYINRINK